MVNGQELNPDYPATVARCLRSAGYRTVQIGKLHFQCHEDKDLDPRPADDYGFDVFRLAEEPGCYDDAYMKWLRGTYPQYVEDFTVPRPMTPERRKELYNSKVIDAPWEASYSGWIAEQVCNYLGAWGPRPDPQFIHCGFYAPHPPLNPTTEMMAPYLGTELPDPIQVGEAPSAGYPWSQ